MKKIYISILIIICFFLDIQTKEVIKPKDTSIKIYEKKITTYKHVPKTYEIKSVIKDDVIINNEIVFYSNDPAILEIGICDKAKGFGRGGKISIIGGYAYDANGQIHRFTVEKEFIGDNDFWLTRIIPFNKGKQAIILPSEIFVGKINKSFVFNKEKPIETKKKKKINNKNVNNRNNSSNRKNNCIYNNAPKNNIQFGLINQT